MDFSFGKIIDRENWIEVEDAGGMIAIRKSSINGVFTDGPSVYINGEESFECKDVDEVRSLYNYILNIVNY